jgi:hypothetical protein
MEEGEGMGKHRRISAAPSRPSAANAAGRVCAVRHAGPLDRRAGSAEDRLTHWPPGGWDFHPLKCGQGGHGAKPLSGALVSRASRLPGRGAHFFRAGCRSGESRGLALAETSSASSGSLLAAGRQPLEVPVPLRFRFDFRHDFHDATSPSNLQRPPGIDDRRATIGRAWDETLDRETAVTETPMFPGYASKNLAPKRTRGPSAARRIRHQPRIKPNNLSQAGRTPSRPRDFISFFRPIRAPSRLRDLISLLTIEKMKTDPALR